MYPGATERCGINSWSQFKLNAIKFVLTPKSNVCGSTYVSNQEAPPLVSHPTIANNIAAVFIPNADVPVPTGDDILHIENATLHKWNSTITKYCKVRPTIELPISADVSATTSMRRNLWMSIADIDAVFGNLYVSNMAVARGATADVSFITQMYDIYCTCFFSLKKFLG